MLSIKPHEVQLENIPTRGAAIEAFAAGLGDIPYDRAPNVVQAKSRDFFWYSPILKAQLADCIGDIVVSPRSEADVVAVSSGPGKAPWMGITGGRSSG